MIMTRTQPIAHYDLACYCCYCYCHHQHYCYDDDYDDDDYYYLLHNYRGHACR